MERQQKGSWLVRFNPGPPPNVFVEPMEGGNARMLILALRLLSPELFFSFILNHSLVVACLLWLRVVDQTRFWVSVDWVAD